MINKDKQLIKKSLLILADSTVNSFDIKLQNETGTLIAPFSVCWNLTKALIGNALELRHKKAEEWVKIIEDNPDVFNEKILLDEKFQDAFTYSIEKYLIERNEEKRIIFKNIFLGFTKSKNFESFPLEKFIHTLSQLSEIDIAVLKDVDINKLERNYQIYGANFNRKENILNLISLGILIDTTGTRSGYNYEESPYVTISPYGKYFIAYLKNDENDL